MMMSTETEGEEFVKLAEAVEGLVMEEDDHAEGMERDALYLMWSAESDGEEEFVKGMEATDGLVMEDEEEEERMERDAHPLTIHSRILLRLAINTMTYTTGIFPEKYFNDKSVPLIDMTVKELMPISEESEKLLDWIDEGVYDSKKGEYLKTLLFSVCEWKDGPVIEEYAFSFSYFIKRIDELVVKFSWTDTNGENLSLKLDAAKLSPEHMRSSACKVIRTCALFGGMLDEMQEERCVIMKMINSEDSKAEEAQYDFSLRNECDHNSDDKEQSQTNGLLFMAANRLYPLYLDSGASYHVCGTRNCFHNFKRLKDPVYLDSVENNELMARRAGDLVHQDVKLKGVLFVPRIPFSVVSVGLLDKQGLMISIGDGRFSVYNLEQPALVGHGILNRANKDYPFCSMDWLRSGNSEAMDGGEDADEEDQEAGWIVDSLCANHMVGDLDLLSDRVPVKREFTTAAGVIECTWKGAVRTDSMVLLDVLYCEAIERNLISVSQLDEKGFTFTFYRHRCTIQLRDPIYSSGYALLNTSTNHYIVSEFTEERPLPEPEVTQTKKIRGSKRRKKN